MPGRILGIDISHKRVTAVQVSIGFKGYLISSFAGVDILADGGLNRALEEISQKIDLKNDTCIVSIPEGCVSYRNLLLPFKEPKKIRLALPFEIETLLPFPIDDVVVDFMILDKSDKSEVLAISVNKKILSDHISSLQTFGMNPDIVDIKPVPMVSWLLEQEGTPENGLFLDVGISRNSMALFLKKSIVLIRHFVLNHNSAPDSSNHDEGSRAGFTVEQVESGIRSLCMRVQSTIHSFGWQTNRTIDIEKIFITGIGAEYSGTEELLGQFFNAPVGHVHISRSPRIRMHRETAEVWNPTMMDDALALALRNSKKGRGFDLRKGEFEVKRIYLGHMNEIRKAVAFLILFLMFFTLDMGADYFFLKKRYEMADHRSTELFQRTFPEVKNARYPLLQMKQKIDELDHSAVLLPGGIKRDQKVLDLLMDISRRLPKSLDIDITKTVIDSESIRISGETGTYDTVDSMKNNLEPSEYFSSVTISSANLDRKEKKVNFEIKMLRAK